MYEGGLGDSHGEETEVSVCNLLTFLTKVCDEIVRLIGHLFSYSLFF